MIIDNPSQQKEISKKLTYRRLVIFYKIKVISTSSYTEVGIWMRRDANVIRHLFSKEGFGYFSLFLVHPSSIAMRFQTTGTHFLLKSMYILFLLRLGLDIRVAITYMKSINIKIKREILKMFNRRHLSTTPVS